LAGYRPIGLASSGPSTIHAGRASTYADRRRAAAERLSLAEDLNSRIDAAVHAPAEIAPDGVPIDPSGVLRAAIRALVPLTHRTPDLDVLVSLGPDHRWAAHLRHGPDGVSVELVAGSGRPQSAPHPPSASEAQIAAELAAWLWTGEVNPR
jgi:hypothetical protein